MRTTLNLPAELLEKARKAVGAKTRTEAIIRGLEELIRRKNINELIALKGKIHLDLDLAAARGRPR